jgi:hypothetical protein
MESEDGLTTTLTPAAVVRGVARPWRGTDTALAAAAGLAGLATRWAVRGRSLVSFDSGLLASGLRQFDFDREFPHPPYYPLTVVAGKVLALWTTPTQALVLLSVLASGALCALTYAVGLRVGGRTVGGGAALLVLLSPTAVFNGAAALSYALEAATSAAVGLSAWMLREKPSVARGAVAGAVLSVAVGVRPSSALFLAPVALWAAWRDRRALGAAVVAGAVTTLAWLVPMLAAGGGLRKFLLYNGYQSRNVILSRTAFEDGPAVVAGNLARLGSYVPAELAFLAAVAAVAAVSALALRRHLPHRATPFLAAWALPGFLFYAVVYVGWPVFPSGYVMVLVPPVVVACALVLRRCAAAILATGAPRVAVAGGLAVLVAVAAMPGAWALHWDDALRPQRDADRHERDWAGVESAFPPGSTAMLTFIEWHWARLEHPDYAVWGVRPYWNETGILLVQVAQGQHFQVDRPTAADFLDGPDAPPHPIPPGVERVLVLDEGSERSLLKPWVDLTEVRLPSGHTALAFSTDGLSSVEQALRWYDDAGHLDPSTLPAEDRRGL